MGVNNLWKALAKANAVQQLAGTTPAQHAEIVESVENKVVAVDLSVWLMQAQTQPALLESYDSPYARACKVVFDRTIHWLRYGCLPVFVIEGNTPPAKLAKLQQRCIAQYGSTVRSYDVGNRAGGQFDKLGKAVKQLLDAFGVPCVQAVGEGEAMCAALNLCGWAHACHTLDVDALLFGALTVYRQVHLQTDDPRKSTLVRCDRSEVQKVLGIKSGGDAGLVAVAQLAGGDYDTTGAEQVGEHLALSAVRCLLRGCEDDENILQKLDAALAAGPDPELDALVNCTGCKSCGHEGGMKSRIKQHTSRHGGCAACSSSSGCIPREWQYCECAFHKRADERLLNRVVRRAVQTSGFVSSCRKAAATYSDQLRQAIAAVQREYGLPAADSSVNVFTWRHRPDARLISSLMCRYIKDWDYNQVRLKLLPLLLEWDIRQGPCPSASAGVLFRPAGIRKVSSKGAAEDSSVPSRQQQGWRYVLLVERLQQQQQKQWSDASTAAAADADLQALQEAEDLAIDLAWIAGTARSKPRKAVTAAAAAANDSGGVGSEWGEACYSQCTSTQGCAATPGYTGTQGCSQATSGGQAAGSAGSRSGGSLQFSEHRSVRCSLVDAVWPGIVALYRNPPTATGGRARSGGSRTKAPAAAAVAAPGTEGKQLSVKEFFGIVKDYTVAAKPSAKCNARQPTADGSIPGLAGIGLGSTAAAAPAAAATTCDQEESSIKERPINQSFMVWLDNTIQTTPSQQKHQHQQQKHQDMQHQQPQQIVQDCKEGTAEPNSPTALATTTGTMGAASVRLSAASQKVLSGARSSHGRRNTSKPAASAVVGGDGRRHSHSGRGRGSGKQQVMHAGALERFLQPAAARAGMCLDCIHKQHHQIALGEAQWQPKTSADLHPAQESPASSPLKRSIAPIDCCSDSPEVLPLAARLQTRSKLAVGVSSSAAAAGAVLDGVAGALVHPAKRTETNRARELINSPASSPAMQQAGQLAQTAPPRPAFSAAAAAAESTQHQFTAQYAALLSEIGESPEQSRHGEAEGQGARTKTAKELFQGHQFTGQVQQQPQVVDLLDSDTDSV